MNRDVGITAQGFEESGQDNGSRHWLASEFMTFLGYNDFSVFRKAINKAMAACAALNIPISDNFLDVRRTTDNKVVDYKLTRFACYLSAMNADSKKPEVAKAQAYFAGLAEAVRQYVEAQEGEGIDRVIIRDKISEQEKTLSGVAHQAGVENYPFFQNAGYRGMYNMNLSRLRDLKGVPAGRSVLDFMGKRELAANLFRLSETEAAIKTDGVTGQQRLEATAESVGKRVRDTMITNSHDKPESLPVSEDIVEVRKQLKTSYKELKRIDKKSDPKKPKKQD